MAGQVEGLARDGEAEVGQEDDRAAVELAGQGGRLDAPHGPRGAKVDAADDAPADGRHEVAGHDAGGRVEMELGVGGRPPVPARGGDGQRGREAGLHSHPRRARRVDGGRQGRGVCHPVPPHQAAAAAAAAAAARLPGGQAGVDLGFGAQDDHQAHAQAVEQRQVGRDGAQDVGAGQDLARQQDDEGLAPVGGDVGGGRSEVAHKVGVACEWRE